MLDSCEIKLKDSVMKLKNIAVDPLEHVDPS